MFFAGRLKKLVRNCSAMRPSWLQRASFDERVEGEQPPIEPEDYPLKRSWLLERGNTVFARRHFTAAKDSFRLQVENEVNGVKNGLRQHGFFPPPSWLGLPVPKGTETEMWTCAPKKQAPLKGHDRVSYVTIHPSVIDESGERRVPHGWKKMVKSGYVKQRLPSGATLSRAETVTQLIVDRLFRGNVLHARCRASNEMNFYDVCKFAPPHLARANARA